MLRRLENLKKLPIKNKKDYKMKSKKFKLRLKMNRKDCRIKFLQMKSIMVSWDKRKKKNSVKTWRRLMISRPLWWHWRKNFIIIWCSKPRRRTGRKLQDFKNLWLMREVTLMERRKGSLRRHGTKQTRKAKRWKKLKRPTYRNSFNSEELKRRKKSNSDLQLRA